MKFLGTHLAERRKLAQNADLVTFLPSMITEFHAVDVVTQNSKNSGPVV